MIRNTATAENFKTWTAKAKSATEAQLRYIIQDCREAEIAMRGWNPEREFFYADQGFTFSDELARRLKKGVAA